MPRPICPALRAKEEHEEKTALGFPSRSHSLSLRSAIGCGIVSRPHADGTLNPTELQCQ